MQKCSAHGNECWTWNILGGCELLGFPCTLSGYPIILQGAYSGLCYGGKNKNTGTADAMTGNAELLPASRKHHHEDHGLRHHQQQQQQQQQQPPASRFHIANGTGPCKDGLTLKDSEECAAAFLALVGELPITPNPTFNPCCDPADNLPYGCTLRRGDNDFIFNSNANSTDKYVDASRAAVCGTNTSKLFSGARSKV